MARKYTNESYLSASIDNAHDESQEYNITKVKIPYFFKVTVLEMGAIGVFTRGENKGKPIMSTQDYQPCKKPFPKEWNIVSYEPVEIIFQNKCLTCHKEGRPRISL